MVLCLLPSSKLSKLSVPITFSDVIVHFLMFFSFSAALYLDITKKRIKNYKMTTVIFASVLVSFGLGALTEMMQYLIIPLNRTWSLSDLLSDFLGSISGIVLMAVIKRKSFAAP